MHVNLDIPSRISILPFDYILTIAAAQSFYIRFMKRAPSCRADPLPRPTSHNLPDFEAISWTPLPQFPAIIQIGSPGRRAAHLIDMMENDSLVGAADGPAPANYSSPPTVSAKSPPPQTSS